MNAVAIKDAAETDRLAALDACGILDTPPEPKFDFLARLAAEVCGAEMAGISFVDGMPSTPAPRCAPRRSASRRRSR